MLLNERENGREDVSSYWVTLNKRGDTEN